MPGAGPLSSLSPNAPHLTTPATECLTSTRPTCQWLRHLPHPAGPIRARELVSPHSGQDKEEEIQLKGAQHPHSPISDRPRPQHDILLSICPSTSVGQQEIP